MTIDYHGTPITPNDLLYEMAGASFCVPFTDPRQVSLCHKIGASVMLDHGGFSVETRGFTPDWQGFYEWCDPWLDSPTTWAIIPDVIAGDEEVQDELLAQWPHGEKGAPVWHLHEHVERLLRLIDEWPLVCFGSSGQYWQVMSDSWQRRMDHAWREISKRHRRTPKTHMLRGMQTLGQRWPFYSVDSTDIARNHNRRQNSVSKMLKRWNSLNCPPRFVCLGEQMEFLG